MVTVILCTYKGEKYLQTQVDSINDQVTEEEYRLEIFDDEVRRSGSAARNFLSAIREVPESGYYMLSDQDDIWHPDKVDRLTKTIRRLEGERGQETPLLVFSDAVVVDNMSRIISASFVRYEGLSPNRTKFNQLLLMNQVTGAACIFNNALRRMLLSRDVPEKAAVHDHWLALAASVSGEIHFLDEALYDYRQHGANVLGAKEAGLMRETGERLGEENDARAKENYNKLFAQAEEFLEQYRDVMSPEQLDAIRHFTGLPKMGKLEKIKTILKYGFTYNRFYRTLGELIFI